MQYGDVVKYTKYDQTVNALVVSHDHVSDEVALVFLDPSLDKGRLTQASPTVLYGVKKLDGDGRVGWEPLFAPPVQTGTPSVVDLDAAAAEQSAKEATADETPTADLEAVLE